MKSLYVLPISAVLMFTGCSKVKELQEMPSVTKEMRDTTSDMSKTTKDMAKTTNGMSKTTNDMKEGTDVMYLQIRSKEAQETRDRNFIRLNEVDSFEQKVTQAVAYSIAFEYHLWTNRPGKGDNEDFRKELQLRAVEEYFRAVRENLAAFKDLEDIKPTSDKSEALNLYALSVSLHRIHDFQEVLTHNEDVEVVSMLSMIKDALKKAEPLEKGLIGLADLEDYEKEILNYQEEAEFLLSLRYNMLMAMTLSCVSDIKKEYSAMTLGIPGLLNKLGHLLKKWDSKYETLNTAQQDKVNTFINEAISTRDFMRSVGIEVNLDKNVRKIFSKMKVNEKACDGNCPQDEASNIEEFNKGIQNILFN